MSPSCQEVRVLAVCLLAFSGFLRCEKLLKLECADYSDVEFNTDEAYDPVKQISLGKVHHW